MNDPGSLQLTAMRHNSTPARVFVVVCAAQGLKHESAIHCDGLMSLEKSRLTDYVGELTADKLRELDNALLVALGVPTSARPSG
jgi:mRNA-degrading endonuclease toxin of MazEF toxin-antitoxin module